MTFPSFGPAGHAYFRSRLRLLTATAALVLAAVVGPAAPATADVAGKITLISGSANFHSGPSAIAAGPDGNMWFTEYDSSRIARLTPDGFYTEFATGLTPGGRPGGITAGPDGAMWFTEYEGNRIGRITPDGSITVFGGLSAFSRPTGIVAGPDGNLWFTEHNGNAIGRITTAGVVTEFTTGITAGANPAVIAAGPDGNLWFTEYNGNRIGRITPSGVITEFGFGISADSKPFGIAAGADGNMWFTEYSGDAIGRITINGVVTEFKAGLTPNSQPLGIAAGPDGNLWFAEYFNDSVGRISTSGVITEFGGPGIISFNSGISGIAAGPDGNMWFTEYAEDQIGTIGTGVTATGAPWVAPLGGTKTGSTDFDDSPATGQGGGPTTQLVTCKRLRKARAKTTCTRKRVPAAFQLAAFPGASEPHAGSVTRKGKKSTIQVQTLKGSKYERFRLQASSGKSLAKGTYTIRGLGKKRTIRLS